jgi:hypothetical protein
MFIIAQASARYLSDGVFYVYPRRVFGNTFTAGDITRLETELRFNGAEVSYEAVGGGQLASELMSAYATLVYTDPGYVDMNRQVFADGYYFGEQQQGLEIIVLSEALAWKLFGSADVAGMTVTMDGVEHTIAGVIGQEAVGEENFFAWVPLRRNTPDAYAESLYIRPQGYDKIAGYRLVSDAIAAIPKDVRNYRIVDINEYCLSIARRPVLCLSVMGVYAAVVLVFKIARLLRAELIKRSLSGSVSIIAGIALCAVILYFVNFDIWVPGFDGGGQLFTTLTNAGLLPGSDYLPYNLLRLKTLNAYSNIGLAVCGAAFVNVVALSGRAATDAGRGSAS